MSVEAFDHRHVLYEGFDCPAGPDFRILGFALTYPLFPSDPREIKVLDLGCGRGANAFYLARLGFQVFGIDQSKLALDIAKSICRSMPNVTLLKGDITGKLPFTSGTFHYVIDVRALESISREKLTPTLEEVDRVLKRDGAFQSIIAHPFRYPELDTVPVLKLTKEELTEIYNSLSFREFRIFKELHTDSADNEIYDWHIQVCK